VLLVAKGKGRDGRGILKRIVKALRTSTREKKGSEKCRRNLRKEKIVEVAAQ